MGWGWVSFALHPSFPGPSPPSHSFCLWPHLSNPGTRYRGSGGPLGSLKGRECSGAGGEALWNRTSGPARFSSSPVNSVLPGGILYSRTEAGRVAYSLSRCFHGQPRFKSISSSLLPLLPPSVLLSSFLLLPSLPEKFCWEPTNARHCLNGFILTIDQLLISFFFLMWTNFFKSLFWIYHNIASVLFWFLSCKVSGILGPQPRIEPTHPILEGRVSTTGQPGQSQTPSLLIQGPTTCQPPRQARCTEANPTLVSRPLLPVSRDQDLKTKYERATKSCLSELARAARTWQWSSSGVYSPWKELRVATCLLALTSPHPSLHCSKRKLWNTKTITVVSYHNPPQI